MSKLSTLIDDARAGLSVQQSIPGVRWDAIASHCGPPEIEEIKARIIALKEELATVEEWDGDTQDDIHFAISRFSRLLELTDLGISHVAEWDALADLPTQKPWWKLWN